ncbi:MAG: glutathione S-transferase family protein [Candidatus Lambdaproteobacteria bacterium]|nr:glutathione S-transferase family protein [Candidatus Lambdaproteobacteria bacterium]
MLRLYDYLPSGNGYKVRLLLTQLGLPFQLIELDIMRGETRTPAYLCKNPNGRVPLLELEDGTLLPESNAILYYLARDTPYFPLSRLAQAQVLQWMCFEQYSHEPNIATARHWIQHVGVTPEREAALAEKQRLGRAALAVMEGHLRGHTYFVGEAYSIADIALYAYTHVAHEGGFDLAPFGAIAAWLARVRAQPRHLAITARPG